MRAHPVLLVLLGAAAYWALQHFAGVGVTGKGKAG
jgi:hypothetical protein